MYNFLQIISSKIVVCDVSVDVDVLEIIGIAASMNYNKKRK